MDPRLPPNVVGAIEMGATFKGGKPMNDKVQKFMRDTLKSGLAQLPESNRVFFKRMYSFEDLDADINDVVDAMPEEKLDWAMQQVQRSIDKLEVPK